jgi:hypothetical protein
MGAQQIVKRLVFESDVLQSRVAGFGAIAEVGHFKERDAMMDLVVAHKCYCRKGCSGWRC